jgi:hypothetical protein
MTRAELIAALEAATGPNRILDLAIFLHVYPQYRDGGIAHYDLECSDLSIVPRFTASLDAALTLVPEICSLGLNRSITLACEAFVCGHDLYRSGEGKTLAIALCIAALKAREGKDE